jgi:galactokinase
MIEELKQEFINCFAKMPERIFFCPGRVNLIGEHIDYNGGQVLPCAISKGTYLAIGRNTGKRFGFYSMNFPEKAELHLQTSYSKTGSQWYNFPLGVIDHIMKSGCTVSGLDMLFFGDLPVGAGLSSSASVEVVTAYALNAIFQLGIETKDMVVFCTKVENEFIGVHCGIMDQFAVAMGKKEKAILLNCDTLAHTYIPFSNKNYSLIIINTNKPRTLVDSKYNERFAECGKALTALKSKLNIQNLCDLDPDTLDANRELISDVILRKRAWHVITENERVKQAVWALQQNNLVQFGQLMYASHQSLKENYEVTGEELDTVVEFCKSFDGCIGARMTGAGFGGCAIALVKKNLAEDFSSRLISYYAATIGYKPSLFLSGAEDGVREIRF